MSEADLGLPDDLPHVIVLDHEMDAGLVATYPSALAGAATGREYSHEAAVVMQLAAYIRNLGYDAVPSMNDTGLVIPFAIKTGLGEYARNQMVIPPEFGPRLRFSKIFTNLPLAHDAPARAACALFATSAPNAPTPAHPKRYPMADPRPTVPTHPLFPACANGRQTPKNALASGPKPRRIAPSACGSARSTATSPDAATACG